MNSNGAIVCIRHLNNSSLVASLITGIKHCDHPLILLSMMRQTEGATHPPLVTLSHVYCFFVASHSGNSDLLMGGNKMVGLIVSWRADPTQPWGFHGRSRSLIFICGLQLLFSLPCCGGLVTFGFELKANSYLTSMLCRQRSPCPLTSLSTVGKLAPGPICF
jgi:hypothetical protein